MMRSNALRSLRSGARRCLVVGLLAGTLLAATPLAPDAFAWQPPPATADEFVPVSDLPAKESLPAAPLLVAAYAVVWLMLMGYLVMLWRRLARVEQEMAGIERQIAQGRRS